MSRLPLARIGLVCVSLGLLGLTYLYSPWQTGEVATEDAEEDAETGAVATEEAETGAVATGTPADSDGRVPIKRVCHADKQWESWYRWDKYEYPDGSEKVVGTIYLDECKLRDLGAGPDDEKNFIDHERGHAAGWGHGQGTPETNPAYHPKVKVTGR